MLTTKVTLTFTRFASFDSRKVSKCLDTYSPRRCLLAHPKLWVIRTIFHSHDLQFHQPKSPTPTSLFLRCSASWPPMINGGRVLSSVCSKVGAFVNGASISGHETNTEQRQKQFSEGSMEDRKRGRFIYLGELLHCLWRNENMLIKVKRKSAENSFFRPSR